MVFHHSNGSCYVIDCGSAHGTFVNGRRIASPSATGVVVPHKVRRGAIVRFGGPGAPCFILKSLPSHLSNVECLANVDCKQFKVSDEALLVLRNTRLNALGKSSVDVCVHEPTMKSFCVPPTKRPLEPPSVCSSSDCDDDSINGPDCKRMRCSSPPLSPEEPLRLVSPDLPAMTKPRRVTFAVEDAYFYPASITPDESSEEDNASV
jgi:FHA domain